MYQGTIILSLSLIYLTDNDTIAKKTIKFITNIQ